MQSSARLAFLRHKGMVDSLVNHYFAFKSSGLRQNCGKKQQRCHETGEVLLVYSRHKKGFTLSFAFAIAHIQSLHSFAYWKTSMRITG